MFLMLSSNPAMNPGLLKERSKFIRDRQTGRMDFVGANETTKPVIEADYARLITLLDLHLESGKEFLFGHRPSQADYGLFGQLSQLHRVENTSRELLESLSMRVTGWLSFMTDLSGRPVLDEHWDTELAPTTKALRKFINQLHKQPKARATPAPFIPELRFACALQSRSSGATTHRSSSRMRSPSGVVRFK